MTIPAQPLFRRATQTLQDPTSIRWPLLELSRYFTDGTFEIAMYRPDAMVRTVSSHPLQSGTRQTIPAGGSKLIEIIANTSGGKRAVRLVNREVLDAQQPGWHSATAVTEILHYMFDPRDPTAFYVYPPANSSASVTLIYSAYPVVMHGINGESLPADTGSDGSVPTTVPGSFDLPPIYANALLDYALYRAYSKDSEYAGNSARAQNHYASFANALGIEIKATMNTAPTSNGNPNVTRSSAP